eukprot:CAMPEP_0204089394 /NCGR_PEP_ID=MMETSP0360-20130528/187691_1 /ASSEMBLY_ACC=CAM_ASM_000342 /TAXON_ID=268821 /ORGANISM="Scrippsiella Hangoei, Strain SHTV-5" /LENGTH=54 /DNA_ID=CAMNT_0051038623 /DNA_START=231 /DNA_END=395 /DNA_ORIENTATION=+
MLSDVVVDVDEVFGVTIPPSTVELFQALRAEANSALALPSRTPRQSTAAIAAMQ